MGWLAVELAAYVCTFGSMWLGGRKSLWGPIVGSMGFFPWCGIAIHGHVWSLIVVNFVIVGLHARTFFLWRASRKGTV